MLQVEGEETSGDDTWHLASVRVQSARANAGEGIDSTFVYEEWVKPSVKVSRGPGGVLWCCGVCRLGSLSARMIKCKHSRYGSKQGGQVLQIAPRRVRRSVLPNS